MKGNGQGVATLRVLQPDVAAAPPHLKPAGAFECSDELLARDDR
jgi:hypothetical protein